MTRKLIGVFLLVVMAIIAAAGVAVDSPLTTFGTILVGGLGMSGLFFVCS